MPRVALAIPCYVSATRPSDAGHAASVLRALGDDVTLISGRCCGQPAFTSGFRAESQQVGMELLRAAQPFDEVVMPSSSCVSMLQHYLPSTFEGRKSSGAAQIGARFHEFASYVAGHSAIGSLVLRLPGAVAYHDACHARRELRISEDVLGLMARVEGLEVRRLPFEAECCGFGGVFSVKQPEVSAGMREAKLADIEASGARILVSTDLSCLGHIEAGARAAGSEIETWTLAELLARALVKVEVRRDQ